MQQLGQLDGVLRPSLDRLAEQHNSRPGGIPADVHPAGISRASAIGPSAMTSGGHCTLSGSFGEMRGISSTATSSVATRSCQRRSIGS